MLLGQNDGIRGFFLILGEAYQIMEHCQSQTVLVAMVEQSRSLEEVRRHFCAFEGTKVT